MFIILPPMSLFYNLVYVLMMQLMICLPVLATTLQS